MGLGASGRDGEDGCSRGAPPAVAARSPGAGRVCPAVPACPRSCCRWPSAATSRPKGDAERGGTAGIARRCCAGPGGADGEPPPAFRHGIATSWRFWYWCPCLQGQPGSQPPWVLAADLSHCVFSRLHRAMASSLLSTVCSFWVSWPLRPPSQRMTNTNSLEAAGQQQYQEVSWLLPSGTAAVGSRGTIPLSFPLVAVHSSSQLHWPSQSALECLAGAWTPEQGVPHSCARAGCWQPGSGRAAVLLLASPQ